MLDGRTAGILMGRSIETIAFLRAHYTLREGPLSKSWIVKHVAGIPGLFEMVTSDPESPMPRRDAMERVAAIDARGWRGWMEHMATGKRSLESRAEIEHQKALKRLGNAKRLPPGVTSLVHKMHDD